MNDPIKCPNSTPTKQVWNCTKGGQIEVEEITSGQWEVRITLNGNSYSKIGKSLIDAVSKLKRELSDSAINAPQEYRDDLEYIAQTENEDNSTRYI